MDKTKNLIPFNQMSGSQHRELSRKGGSATKGIPKIVPSRKCTPRCPLYGKCIYQVFSKDYNGRCALANMTKDLVVRRRYVNLILADGTKLLETIKTILAELSVEVMSNGTFRDKRNFANDLMRFYEMLYGKKLNIEQNITGDAVITYEELKKVYQEVKISLEDDKNGNKKDESSGD